LNKPGNKDYSKQMTLRRPSVVVWYIINKPSTYETNTIAFAEQPSFDSVDTSEEKFLKELRTN